jgi:hypothetical protein
MTADKRDPLLLPSVDNVLGLATQIWFELTEFDLDEIDGEFYWRCCRRDLVAPIEQLRAELPAVPGSEFSARPVRERFQALRDHLEWGQRTYRIYRQLTERYPERVLTCLLSGTRLSMRLPDVDDEWRDDDIRFAIRIYSGNTTGTAVEEALVQRVDIVGRWLMQHEAWNFGIAEPVPCPKPPRDARYYWMSDETYDDDANVVSLTINIEFALVLDPHPEPYGRTARTPYVQVRVHTPLPPAGAIAREYERVVRDGKAWHLHLPGEGSRQDKEVALRTWSLGLLTRTGMKFIEASRLLHQAIGLAEVSQACFNADRVRLLDRVPEARPYLYTRERDPSGVVKTFRTLPNLQDVDPDL